jgi:hypothetical protein
MAQLALDPASHLAAAVNGWEYPISREAIALADIFDITVAAAGGDTRYPRPWDNLPTTPEIAADITEILNQYAPK